MHTTVTNDVLLALLIIGAVLHTVQFRTRKINKEDGSSNSRVQILVKLILALLVWREYEWGVHFTLVFCVSDLISSINSLRDGPKAKKLDLTVALTDALIIGLAALMMVTNW